MTSSDDLLRQARGQFVGGDGRPRLGLAVVTCMDARVDPWRILGAGPGDMHVVRNAGGVVTDDVLRSLTVSAIQFGTTWIQLIMHTDCGMQGFDDEAFRRRLADRAGAAPPWPMRGFDDLAEAVARGVESLRASPLLRTVERISGHVYDVGDATLRTVVS